MPGVTSPAAIQLEAVAKHYRTPGGLVRAVDGITVDVEGGCSLAITGPSGCGKSTLLGLVGALDVPTTGRVVVGGLEISGLPEHERAEVRRRSLGFVFQSDNLLPYLTAAENVAVRLALHARARDGRRRSLALLAELGLADCSDKLPDQLSGGQRLRVAIARALVHRPAVILADEPTGSVDAASAGVIVDSLLTAHRASHATLVVVSHDPDVASRLGRTLRLRDGRVALSDRDRGA
jgi:putative ABC transport system ATP-binding protein